MNDGEYSKEYFDEKLNEIFADLIQNKEKATNPKAFVLGGQPGSGKTGLQIIAAQKCNGNLVVINADEFRELHPDFKRLNEKYGKDSVDYTGKFSGQMTEALVEKLKKNHYNILVEGTLRTSQVPLDTCEKFKQNGYDVSLVVMAVKPDISFISTIKRYEEMLADGKTPRATQKDSHDYTVSQIPNNLLEIYKSQKFDEILIYNRDNTCLYDMKKMPDKLPNKVMGEMFNGQWTQREFEQFFGIGKQTEIMMENRKAEELTEYKKRTFNSKIVYDIAKSNGLEFTDEMKEFFEKIEIADAANSFYDNLSEDELQREINTHGKDFFKLEMWEDKKPEDISRISYQNKGNLWTGNVFSGTKCVGDFVTFNYEAIKKKFPQIKVMIKSMTLLKKENLTPEPTEKKKERISQTISKARRSNGTVSYRNNSYTERAMEEKDRFNQLVEDARRKNILEYFQESGYNIEKKGGQYYVKEINGLVINAEQNQWYNHYENIGRTNNTLDCLTKVLGIDFKQAVYDLTGKDISSVKSEKNYNNNYSKKPVYTTKPMADVVSQPSKIAKELKMPEQSENFRQLFAYMIKTRKIPSQIVDELVKAKLLYQTINEHNGYKNANAVFVHKDENGEIVGAEIQGCNSNVRYKGVATGTKESCFIFTPNPSQDGKFKKAYIFESAIDLMSFYTFCKKDKIQETAFISMAGLKPTVPLKLQEQGIQIFSCVDNDDAGRKFEKENGFTRPTGAIKMLDDNGFKDWNELLVFKTEHPNSIFDKNAYKSEVQEKETEKPIEEIAEAAQNTMADTLDNSIENDEDDMGGPTM